MARAVLCRELGPPETLTLVDVPSPEPRAGEVVVRVRAAGLNFFDTLIIQGKYQYKPDLPFSPAGEFAGVVERLGDGVAGLRPGDRVMGYVGWGGAREEIAVDATILSPIPDGVSFAEAAGLLVTYGTTLHAFRDRAALAAGETVAVLGASGGVGQAAIEVARAMGARVIACASSDDKLAFCRGMGADETVNYETADLKAELRRLTDGRGTDVIYDPVGGDQSEKALRTMAWGGRFLVIGFASGVIPKMPLNLTLLKGCSIVGVFWGEHTRREPDRHAANMATLLDWCAAGVIRPHIDRTFDLADAPAALRLIADRKVRGKVILTA
jgi:NADPH2:quinone reductase